MSDLISRQDAIDVLDVLCQEHRYKIPGNAETYSQYNEAWQDALDRAEGAIGNLPSAEPEPHWIPCSERLPDAEVLCCDTYGAMIIAYVYEDDRSDTGFTAESDTEFMYHCIAWMPMPEPYSIESDGIKEGTDE